MRDGIDDGVSGQLTADFSRILYADLLVAIGRRESLGATIGRETISAQDIGFRVATDENSEAISKENSERVASDSTTNFGDAEDEEVTD